MAEESKSIWHQAEELSPEQVKSAAEALISLEPEGSSSRFLTIIGDSSNHTLDLLAAYTEQRRFGEKFGNEPDDMAELYGQLGTSICILVLDKEGENGPSPACICRIAVGSKDDPLPTLSVLESLGVLPEPGKEPGYSEDEAMWRVTEEDYRSGLEVIDDGNGKLFDVATLANLEEYRSGVASLQIFAAFARMHGRNYKGFNGRFITTIVQQVADIVNITTGHDVLNVFPGTTPQLFFGSTDTAPYLGLMLPDEYSEEMKQRISTADNETDTRDSTYLFL